MNLQLQTHPCKAYCTFLKKFFGLVRQAANCVPLAKSAVGLCSVVGVILPWRLSYPDVGVGYRAGEHTYHCGNFVLKMCIPKP